MAGYEVSHRFSPGATGSGGGDVAGSRWRWPGRVPGRAAFLAVGLTVLLTATTVVVAVPLGGFGPLTCRLIDAGCPPKPVPAPGPQATRRPRPLDPVEAAVQGRYVALGDSYSSGEGAYDVRADSALNTGRDRCHRSGRSYYPAVAATYRFRRGTAFWACSGARTTNALTGQYGGPPQVGRVDAHTSLITISLGGNDAGFTPVLVRCIVKLPWSSACRDQEPQVRARLAALRGGLVRVLDRLGAKAPYARLLVLGYPRPFPADPGKRVDNLSVADQRWLNAMTDRLNAVIRSAVHDADRRIVAAKGPGTMEFVDTSGAFGGHEVGSARPFLNGLEVDFEQIAARPHSYHPTAAGYQRFATLVNERIKAGPGRRINQFR